MAYRVFEIDLSAQWAANGALPQLIQRSGQRIRSISVRTLTAGADFRLLLGGPDQGRIPVAQGELLTFGTDQGGRLIGAATDSDIYQSVESAPPAGAVAVVMLTFESATDSRNW